MRLLLLATLAFSWFAAQLTPAGTLRATMLATNPVQGRVNTATGEITGVVFDLVTELARRRDVPFKLTPLPDAAAVIESIRSKQADIGFLAVEEERAKQVDFSEPYLMMRNAYLVRADSPIVRSADVDRHGVTVGAVKGQSQQIFASSTLKQARVRVFPTMMANDALVKMLLSGELDAFAANRQRMTEAAATSPRVRLLADDFLLIGQAIVVEKGDAARLAEVNRFVADVRSSGFVAASIERAGLSGSVTTASGRP